MEAVSESSQFSYYKHGVTKNIDTANVRNHGYELERVYYNWDAYLSCTFR